MVLSLAERQAFLAEPHVAALSVSVDDRGPLTIPIWYDYVPGEHLWFLTGSHTVKVRHLRASGRASLLVDRVTPTMRYVGLEGPVEFVASTAADVETMARRYLPPEAVDGFVTQMVAVDDLVVRIHPEHWWSADIAGI